MTLFPEGGHQARGFCGPDKNTLLADDMTDGIRPGKPELSGCQPPSGCPSFRILMQVIIDGVHITNERCCLLCVFCGLMTVFRCGRADW